MNTPINSTASLDSNSEDGGFYGKKIVSKRKPRVFKPRSSGKNTPRLTEDEPEFYPPPRGMTSTAPKKKAQTVYMVPSPLDYVVSAETAKPRAPAYSLGSRRGIYGLSPDQPTLLRQSVPSPGRYDNCTNPSPLAYSLPDPSVYKTNMTKSPAYSMAEADDNTSFLKDTAESPGPAYHYDPTTCKTRSPAYSVSARNTAGWGRCP